MDFEVQTESSTLVRTRVAGGSGGWKLEKTVDFSFDTLYYLPEQLKPIQCIVAGNIDNSLTRTFFIVVLLFLFCLVTLSLCL